MMSDEDVQFSRPKILYYVTPDTSGITYKGRQFVCTVTPCEKVFYTIKQWEEHMEISHRSEKLHHFFRSEARRAL